MRYYLQNFGFGILGTGINGAVLSMTMSSGHNFPLDTTKSFKVTVWDKVTYPNPGDDPNVEIMTAVYSGSVNVYTITRGDEGTTGVAHSAGAAVAMCITATGMNSLGISDIFTSSGSWVCPTGITQIRLTMAAGGGGGGSGSTGNGAGGGGGGSGQVIPEITVPVTPGTTYTITVGVGGNGGTSQGNGSNGGNTVAFGITLTGGNFGSGTGGGVNGGVGGAALAAVSMDATNGFTTPGSIFIAATGKGATGATNSSGGGGGAGSLLAIGGAGAGNAAGNGNPGSLGSGGGGSSNNAVGVGGAGGNGIVIIQY